jgi:hypothetical protein
VSASSGGGDDEEDAARGRRRRGGLRESVRMAASRGLRVGRNGRRRGDVVEGTGEDTAPAAGAAAIAWRAAPADQRCSLPERDKPSVW